MAAETARRQGRRGAAARDAGGAAAAPAPPARRPGWLLGAAAVAWVGVLASALAMVWARHEARELFQQLQLLDEERDALNIEWRQLRLELGALASHSRVERLAREQLAMREPAPDEMMTLGDDDE